MLFADEPVGYSGRRFECGWPARPQPASEIADRAQQFARCLGNIDPAFALIRPDPGMRKLGPQDLGPILEMTPDELADLIDRQGRVDPPKFPAPVSPAGYDLLYRNDRAGLDPSFLSLSIRAGQFGPEAVENRVGLRPDGKHELWRDPERGVQVLDALVEAWDPEWVCAYALLRQAPSEDGEVRSRARPWLAWTAKPLSPRPNPPYRRPYPAPFPLDDAGAPAERKAWRGGELQSWP